MFGVDHDHQRRHSMSSNTTDSLLVVVVRRTDTPFLLTICKQVKAVDRGFVICGRLTYILHDRPVIIVVSSPGSDNELVTTVVRRRTVQGYRLTTDRLYRPLIS